MSDGQNNSESRAAEGSDRPPRSDVEGVGAGDVVWTFESEGQVRSSPTVVGETVFIGGHDGSVYALDAETGYEQWAVDTNAEVESSPAVVSETVFVGNRDGTVYALDATTGKAVWQFDAEDSVYSSPTVVDGTVVVGSDDGVVYGLDGATGESEWTCQTSSSVRTAPAVVDDTVVCGNSNGKVYAIDATTGEQRWKSRTSGTAVRSSPTVSDGLVFIGGLDDTLYAIDMADGTEEWTAGTCHSVWASPTVVGNTVFVGDRAGYIYALDVENGRPVWQADTGNDVFSSPTVAGGTVFVGNDQNRLYALDATTGELEWTLDTDGWIRSSPTVVDGVLFVGSSDGTVYAVDTGTAATSEDSRVELMILGHHGESRYAAQRLKTPTGDYEGWLDAQRSTVQEHLDKAREARNAGTYDRALAWCGDAVEVAEQARDRAREDAPHRVAAIEAQLNELLTLREAIQGERDGRRKSSDRLSQVEDTVDDAAEALAAGNHGDAIESLDDASSALADVTATVESYDLPDTSDRVESLDGRIARLREQARARHDAYRQMIATLNELDETLETAAEAVGSSTSVDGLDDVPEKLDRAREAAATHDFSDVAERIQSLENRYQRLVQPSDTHIQVPETIADVSCHSLTYDDILKNEPLGGGGNADVYAATAATDDVAVELALKEPRMSGTLHTDVVERMMTEAETWQQLDDHDHIVSVVDYGSEPLPWIGMEYMDGGHLGAYTDDIDFDQALWTAIATTKAVRHAHRRGVAHLDLKPANILFRELDNAWDVPKVADWGLSKHLLDHSKSVEGMTVEYAAPEQFDDEYGTVDDITDVYQLGAVFYELFTSRPPFEGKPFKVIRKIEREEPTPPSAVADVPEQLDDILLQALATEKSERYDAVVLLRNDLQELFES